MATLREQIREMRQTAYFDTTLNPRAEAVTLCVGNPPVEVAATVLIRRGLGKTSRDETSGVTATANQAAVSISKAEVADLPQLHDGYRGTMTDANGDSWALMDVQYEDDAFFHVQAKRTNVAGVGKHRAMPWGG